MSKTQLSQRMALDKSGYQNQELCLKNSVFFFSLLKRQNAVFTPYSFLRDIKGQVLE